MIEVPPLTPRGTKTAVRVDKPGLAVTSGVSLLVLMMSLGGSDWANGVAVHEGIVMTAWIGLGDVDLEPADANRGGFSVSLRDLCLQNYTRRGGASEEARL
jgi:hypothetical protein